MLALRYNYNSGLRYINLYIFRSSLAHHQTVYSCIKQSTSLKFEIGPTRNLYSPICLYLSSFGVLIVTKPTRGTEFTVFISSLPHAEFCSSLKFFCVVHWDLWVKMKLEDDLFFSHVQGLFSGFLLNLILWVCSKNYMICVILTRIGWIFAKLHTQLKCHSLKTRRECRYNQHDCTHFEHWNWTQLSSQLHTSFSLYFLYVVS